MNFDVIYNGAKDGLDADQEKEKALGLVAGKTYTAQTLEVHGFSARIELYEFPHISLNTINFDWLNH